jgi:hypothetical protein
MIGSSELEGVFGENGFRYGTFIPNETGARLMPVATGVSPAVLALRGHYDDPTLLRILRDATAAEHALELELRDSHGDVIPTEQVWISDLHYAAKVGAQLMDEDEGLPRFSPEKEAEIQAAAEELFETWQANRGMEPWMAEPDEKDVEYPQYQLRVQVVDPASLPPV